MFDNEFHDHDINLSGSITLMPILGVSVFVSSTTLISSTWSHFYSNYVHTMHASEGLDLLLHLLRVLSTPGDVIDAIGSTAAGTRTHS